MGKLVYLIVIIIALLIMSKVNFLFGIMLVIVSSLIYAYEVALKNKQKQQEVDNLSEEERERYYEIHGDNIIDYTIIVQQKNKKNLGNTLLRGMVGEALLGRVGLIGGIMTGKEKGKTTFTVIYKSGRREVVTVDNDSYKFSEYAKYIR